MGHKISLYAESFAPWCEKVRWALDHHRIPYREIDQVPLLAEVTLRIATRRLRRRMTMPLLIDGDVVLMNSFDIARYAEAHGGGAPLFPARREDEVAAWNERSEAVMTSGRAMLLPRMSRNPQALREQVPPFVPRVLGPVAQGAASLGVSHLMRKYNIRVGEDARHDTESRRALDQLRAALADGRKHLLGDLFSYADIAMAAALQFILPVDGRHIRLGPATREAWTHPRLAADYADLLAWRDSLYATRR
jgi:glutathione S-transferase